MYNLSQPHILERKKMFGPILGATMVLSIVHPISKFYTAILILHFHTPPDVYLFFFYPKELQERVEAYAASNDASAEENSILRRERDCAESRLQEPQGESHVFLFIFKIQEKGNSWGV